MVTSSRCPTKVDGPADEAVLRKGVENCSCDCTGNLDSELDVCTGIGARIGEPEKLEVRTELGRLGVGRRGVVGELPDMVRDGSSGNDTSTGVI